MFACLSRTVGMFSSIIQRTLETPQGEEGSVLGRPALEECAFQKPSLHLEFRGLLPPALPWKWLPSLPSCSSPTLPGDYFIFSSCLNFQHLSPLCVASHCTKTIAAKDLHVSMAVSTYLSACSYLLLSVPVPTMWWPGLLWQPPFPWSPSLCPAQYIPQLPHAPASTLPMCSGHAIRAPVLKTLSQSTGPFSYHIYTLLCYKTLLQAVCMYLSKSSRPMHPQPMCWDCPHHANTDSKIAPVPSWWCQWSALLPSVACLSPFLPAPPSALFSSFAGCSLIVLFVSSSPPLTCMCQGGQAGSFDPPPHLQPHPTWSHLGSASHLAYRLTHELASSWVQSQIC